MAEPKIEQIDSGTPSGAILNQAVTALENGGMGVSPTETRYGLLARAERAATSQAFYGL